MKRQLILAIAVIAVGGGAAYYFTSDRGSVVDNGLNSENPRTVTEKFYAAYENCLKNPPPAAEGEVSVYCQNNTGYTAKNFSANLEQGGTAASGADPIACAQNIPYNSQVSDPSFYGESDAQVVVQEFFAGPRIDIRVELIKEDGAWKVNNVVCPEPSSSGGNGFEEPVAAVKAHASEKAGVSQSSVAVVSITPKNWSDGCLGLGGPDEGCLAAITPGYEVVIQVNGAEQTYRTNATGSQIRRAK